MEVELHTLSKAAPIFLVVRRHTTIIGICQQIFKELFLYTLILKLSQLFSI